MKYIHQFGLILAISFLGEALKFVIPLPIPASIYGLLLMLLALHFKIFPLESVKESGELLIDIMPLMFIPAGVGLLESWDTLGEIWLPVLVITAVSTVIVMAVTGHVTQFVIRAAKKKKGTDR
ncbi:MAG TPA: CidA/LrgA family protein [Candidatus Blautia gallistercoris]|uniref:CidA/LrgA family protein n=1 Tax=Candidatus Blautia gallistercoris TaxID=2838490 RepID=A0A9D2B3H0_9FIRM|nr:CidA/LrgA family protein [Candidatus Blautia gallistercoris]